MNFWNAFSDNFLQRVSEHKWLSKDSLVHCNTLCDNSRETLSLKIQQILSKMLLCITFRNITGDTNLIVVRFPEELKTNQAIIENIIIHSHTLKCVFHVCACIVYG